MTDKYYTVREVAYRFGVHETSVRRYIRQGKLKAVKIGDNVRITEQAMAEFVTRK